MIAKLLMGLSLATSAALNINLYDIAQSNYYFEPGPNISFKDDVTSVKADEKRISEIKDPLLKIEELNKLDPKEIGKWSHYNSGDFGFITTPVDQYPFNICWAFSTANTGEAALLRQGLVPLEQATTFKLSALSITQTINDRRADSDPLLNTPSDTYSKNWNDGFYVDQAAVALSQGIAPAISKGMNSDLASDYVRPEYIAKDILFLDPTSKEDVKRAINEYGAVTLDYDTDFVDSNFYNDYKIDEYYKNNGDTRKSQSHAITIIGWDDNVSTSNFSYNVPKVPGAWLTKNSWGDSYGTNGTQYLSYESELKDTIAYKYMKNDLNLHKYYYDGGYENYESVVNKSNSKDVKAAAVFESKVASKTTDEYLEQVNVKVDGHDANLKVEIYKNVDVNFGNRHDKNNDPTKGELIESATTYASYWAPGIYTIDLKERVKINSGENFSIVITASNEKGDVGFSASKEYSSYNDQTYYQDINGDWKNTFDLGSMVLRIKGNTKSYPKEGSEEIKDINDAKLRLNKYVSKIAENEFTFENPQLFYKGNELKENIDYLVTYKKFRNEVEDTSNQDAVISYIEMNITGIGNFEGTYRHFYIPVVAGLYPNDDAFISSGYFAEFKAPYNVTKLKDLNISKNWKFIDDLNTNIEDGQKYKVMYVGEESYLYRIPTIDLYINLPKPSDINIETTDYTVTGLEDSYSYNGGEIRPDIKLEYLGYQLKYGADYLVEYRNNKDSGQAEIYVRGIGKYAGVKKLTFNINKASNKVIDFKLVNNIPYAYSVYGEVEFKYFNDKDCLNEAKTLVAGNKYYVKPFVKGSSNYEEVKLSDTKEPLVLTYKSDSIDIPDIKPVEKKFNLDNIKLENQEVTYNGTEQRNNITIQVESETLKLGRDYELQYISKDYTNVGVVTIRIKGINDYKTSGSFDITYEIKKADNKITKFEKNDDKFIVESTFGKDEYQLKYYDSLNFDREITKEEADRLNVYYVKAYIGNNSNYNEIYSDNYIEVINNSKPEEDGNKPIETPTENNDNMIYIGVTSGVLIVGVVALVIVYFVKRK